MINKVTKEPIRIHPQEGAWPFISLPLEQLADVKRVLEANSIRYYTTGTGVSVHDGPFFALIDLAYDTDVSQVQALLDAA